MSVRKANAHWKGTLKDGEGMMYFSDYSGKFTYASRFEEGQGTNPEELVGAAISGCFSMFLSALITGEGYSDQDVKTEAYVTLEKDDIGPKISKIRLECEVICEGLDRMKFNELVLQSKEKCPVSRLYSGGTAIIEVDATLK